VTAAIRGIAIALPILLLFGVLLTSADAVFANLLGHLFQWDIENLVSHLSLWAIFAWLTAGYLRGLVAKRCPHAVPSFASGPRGMIEGAIVLGLLDVLFLAFVIVQVRYLFGGAALVMETAGLTYAEYARRGFFELAWVAALAVPLLLVTHTLAVGPESRGRRWYTLLAGLMTLLLFVIIASAMKRMRLYVDVYGLTELRLYTTVFMAWLALVFAWFMATVLCGRRRPFAFGVLVSAGVLLVGLNAANPDALIVRVNAARWAAGPRWDGAYLASLSGDAVPALIRALPSAPPSQRASAACRLLREWGQGGSADWRTRNRGRDVARAAVAANQAILTRWRDTMRSHPPASPEPKRVPAQW
jgi:hypothetical protein